MSLATLPPELYIAILSHIPSSNLQSSTLNLSRAVPFATVPLRPLFEHISISRHQQLSQLYRRLQYPPKVLECPEIKESTWVKSFKLAIWQVDADVVVNVLALLSCIERLDLKIGPVFAPEHLQDIFIKPALSLSTLNLRFRPYVQIATYYQFLKGSYFDSTLEQIASWPSNSALTHISIFQDPLPPSSSESHVKATAFAQPIVFFSLVPLTTLSLSAATQHVTHVRLRIPARHLVPFIASPDAPGSVKYPFPQALFLDLSTSIIRDFSGLEILLNHVGRGKLRHLLLDDTKLCNGNDREWEALGRTCSLAGVHRSRQREKALKAWAEAEAMAYPVNEGDPGAPDPGFGQERRPRSGRRGLATATISLRDRLTDVASITPAHIPVSRTDKPRKATKTRILPSTPKLLSLCTSLPCTSGPSTVECRRALETRARTDFAKGWSDGLGQLRSIWTRLRQSQSNGIKIVRFDVEGRNNSDEDVGMFAGLVEMGKPGIDVHWEDLRDVDPPILCFAGPRGEDFSGDEWPDHPEGCGHRLSWDVWGDNL